MIIVNKSLFCRVTENLGDEQTKNQKQKLF